MSLLFGRKKSLSHASDFKRVFEHRCKFGGRGIIIYASLNQLDYPRIGFVIAKRQIDNAVKRNKIRRIVREHIRLEQVRLEGLDIVITVKREILNSTAEGLRHCLDELLKRVVKKLHFSCKQL